MVFIGVGFGFGKQGKFREERRREALVGSGRFYDSLAS